LLLLLLLLLLLEYTMGGKANAIEHCFVGPNSL